MLLCKCIRFKIKGFYSPHSIGVWCPKILASLSQRRSPSAYPRLSPLLPTLLPAYPRYMYYSKRLREWGIREAKHTLENGPANYGSVFIHPPVYMQVAFILYIPAIKNAYIFFFQQKKYLFFDNNIYLKILQLSN